MSYKSTHNKYILSVAAAGVICGLMACRSEGEPTLGNGQETLTFEGYVHSEAALTTRATSEISADDYGKPFYIAMDYLDSQNDSQTKIGTYKVPTGMRGQFSPIESSSAINWYNRTGDHTFHAWDFPQTVSGTPYTPSTKPQTIYFDNRFGGTNNNELEKFIGAVSGPYNYESQGQYVPLHFYHLVSKINFVRFRAFNYDPSKPFGYYTNPQVRITLYGLPKEAVFYPDPANDTEGNLVMPYVAGETQPDNVEDTADAWQIVFTTPGGTSNFPAYICPDYDFRKIRFKVEITAPNWDVTPTGPFYGSFGDLEFTGRTDKNDKDPILRAGEVLNISINLYPEGGTGGGITITKWETMDEQDGMSYPRTGIYEGNELQGILGGSSVDWDEMFGLLGVQENGENVFNIYNNVTVDDNNFMIEDGYILDGLGHLVTIPEDSEEVNLKNVRDIYISNGENTIWVDENGTIWVQQEDGQFSQTTANINTSDNPFSLNPDAYQMVSDSEENPSNPDNPGGEDNEGEEDNGGPTNPDEENSNG
ncbi:MAG: fimbrillin family protein [Muribaculaceae bacterium]|nr:fimbrillin family protein [Muribaculaceae bacterium]